MDNALVQRYLNVTIDVGDIARKRTHLMFSNQHYSLMGIRPHSEQLVEIGGIHIQEKSVNASLPPEIDEFLSKSTKDVLFISWGSMVRGSTMDQSKLAVIVAVLQRLNMKVIWKWESDEIPVKDDQFKFVKWAPQLALLCK